MRFKIFGFWLPEQIGKPIWQRQVRKAQMRILYAAANYAELYGLNYDALEDIVNLMYSECRRRAIRNIDRAVEERAAQGKDGDR